VKCAGIEEMSETANEFKMYLIALNIRKQNAEVNIMLLKQRHC